jgi:very-short-patch-repair endonuclease
MGKTPRDFCPYSNHKAWFYCKICRKSFLREIDKITIRGCICSDCTYDTESILKDFLLEDFPAIEKQKSFRWCRSFKNNFFRFDFYEESLRIIIELDGGQHFRQVLNWQHPEERRLVDVYKMKLAIKYGITVIRILQEDVYNNKFDWETKLRNTIKRYDTPRVIYLTNPNKETDIYNGHIKLYEENTIEELEKKIRNFGIDDLTDKLDTLSYNDGEEAKPKKKRLRIVFVD